MTISSCSLKKNELSISMVGVANTEYIAILEMHSPDYTEYIAILEMHSPDYAKLVYTCSQF